MCGGSQNNSTPEGLSTSSISVQMGARYVIYCQQHCVHRNPIVSRSANGKEENKYIMTVLLDASSIWVYTQSQSHQ